MGIVRAYQSNDEIQVNALYTKVLSTKDNTSPALNLAEVPRHLAPVTYVYEDGNDIVGCSSLLPIEAYIHGKDENIGILTEIVVDDQYNVSKIKENLNKKMIEIAEEMDLKTLINIGRDEAQAESEVCFESHRKGEIYRFSKRNASGMIPWNEFWKKVKSDKATPLYEAWELEEQEYPDDELTHFIYKKRKWKKVHIKKHETHYQGRENKYQYLKLTYDGEVTGYAVINTREKGKVREAYITDILSIDHPEAWDMLIQALRMKLESYDVIELCISPDKQVINHLKKNGFKESKSPVNLNIIDLDESLRNISMDEWWLLLGNTDTYH